MPLDLVTIPCLSDNYAFLIHDAATGATAVVDVPEVAPILAALKSRGWTLTDILITHHHEDHIRGRARLAAAATGARVWGAAADAHRLPPLDVALREGDTVTIGGETVQVFDVLRPHRWPHRLSLPQFRAVFTADSLMAWAVAACSKAPRLKCGPACESWRRCPLKP